MNLHTNRELLHDAILATSDMFNIREIYIEKDYWVTVALYAIFHSHIAQETVFKGGTSLSKCYNLIERFSEDIDLVIFRNKGENDNQLKKKIRAISKAVGHIIPEIEIDGITNKMGNIRKTVHHYSKIFEGDFGQVRDSVIVEATWLGYFEPFSKMQVSSYIYEMMEQQDQQALITEYHMAPFTIQVLSKYRTFCEKIMSLVRFSKSETPIIDLRNKIRHIYDIHQMLQDDEIQSFFKDNEFADMLLKVGHDDMTSYKNNNDWILEHPSTALIFAQPKETWEHLGFEYKTRFKNLVTGELPAEESLIDSLNTIASRLEKIVWQIKIK